MFTRRPAPPLRAARGLKVMDTVLRDRPYLADQYSIADISAAAVLYKIRERLPAEHRQVGAGPTAAWFERVTSRPAWQSCLAPQ